MECDNFRHRKASTVVHVRVQIAVVDATPSVPEALFSNAGQFILPAPVGTTSTAVTSEMNFM